MRKTMLLLLAVGLLINPLTILSNGVLWTKGNAAIPIAYLNSHILLFDEKSYYAPFSLIKSSDGQAVEGYDKAEINIFDYDKYYIVSKGFILLSEQHREGVSCFDIVSGKKLWTNKDLYSLRMIPDRYCCFGADGNIYIYQETRSQKNYLYVVNSVTGKTIKTYDSLELSTVIALLYANKDCLMTYDGCGYIHYYDMINKKKIWQYGVNITEKVELYNDKLICFGWTYKEGSIHYFEYMPTIFIIDINTGKEIIKPVSCINYVRYNNKLFIVQNLDNDGKKIEPIIFYFDLDSNKIVKSQPYTSGLAYPYIVKYNNSIILISFKEGISYFYLFNDNLEQIKETLTMNMSFSNVGMCSNYLILAKSINNASSCNIYGLKLFDESNNFNYIKYIMYLLLLLFSKINP